MEPIQLSLSSSWGDTSPGHKQGLLQEGDTRPQPHTHKSCGMLTGALLQGSPCPPAQGSALIPGALGVPSVSRGVVVLLQEALLRPLQETRCATGCAREIPVGSCAVQHQGDPENRNSEELPSLDFFLPPITQNPCFKKPVPVNLLELSLRKGCRKKSAQKKRSHKDTLI